MSDNEKAPERVWWSKSHERIISPHIHPSIPEHDEDLIEYIRADLVEKMIEDAKGGRDE